MSLTVVALTPFSAKSSRVALSISRLLVPCRFLFSLTSTSPMRGPILTNSSKIKRENLSWVAGPPQKEVLPLKIGLLGASSPRYKGTPEGGKVFHPLCKLCHLLGGVPHLDLEFFESLYKALYHQPCEFRTLGYRLTEGLPIYLPEGAICYGPGISGPPGLRHSTGDDPKEFLWSK